MTTEILAKNSTKRERTRQLILNAAMNILATKELASSSIDELMSHTGMTRATFYNYFQNREELLDDVLNEVRRYLHEHIQQHIPDDISPAATISCTVFGIQQYALDHPRFGWILVRLSADNDFFRPPALDDQYFSRPNNALMSSVKSGTEFMSVHIYCEGIAINILRSLLMQHINLVTSEQVVAMFLRGLSFDESEIDKAIVHAREFAQFVHTRYKDWQCSNDLNEA